MEPLERITPPCEIKWDPIEDNPLSHQLRTTPYIYLVIKILTHMGVTLINGKLYHQRKKNKKEEKCSHNSEASNSILSLRFS